MARKRALRSASRTHTAGASPGVRRWRIAVELTALELAAGHDGLFRGGPDPAVLLGAFFVTSIPQPRVMPLGRVLVRFAPRGRLPLEVAPPSRTVLKVSPRGADGDRLLVVAIAFEEDSGNDIERLYAHLDGGAGLRFWEVGATEPAPVTLAELASFAPSTPPFATRVNIIDDGADLRDSCAGDGLVGAGVIVVAPRRSEDHFRVQFLSGDRRNDWTAVLGVKTA